MVKLSHCQTIFFTFSALQIITTLNKIGMCTSIKNVLQSCTLYIKDHDKVVHDAVDAIEVIRPNNINMC